MYLLAIAIIGARQHALLILMHDGVSLTGIPDRDSTTACQSCWHGHIWLRRDHTQESHRASSLFEQRKGSRLEAPTGDPAWVFPKPADDLARLLFRDVSD